MRCSSKRFSLQSLTLAAMGALVVCTLTPLSPAQVNATPAALAEMPRWQVDSGSKLEFDVATIKPSTPDSSPQVNFTLGPGDAYATTGGRFFAKGISLLDYIRFAHKLTDGQVEILQTSAPGWIASER